MIAKKSLFFLVLTYHERRISVEPCVQDHGRSIGNSNLYLVFGDESVRGCVENDSDDLGRILLAPSVG